VIHKWFELLYLTRIYVKVYSFKTIWLSIYLIQFDLISEFIYCKIFTQYVNIAYLNVKLMTQTKEKMNILTWLVLI